jgi:C1A family cysteine protease
MGAYWSNEVIEYISPKERTYGWKRECVDIRDKYKLSAINLTNVELEKVIDLRDKCPSVYDQGALGSCTANAIAAAYEFNEIKESENDIFIPSRLFIYYNERNMENCVDTDSGAQIRDGIKCINKIGVCKENEWPYVIKNFTEKPNQNCFSNAKLHQSVTYSKIVQTIDCMKQCLSDGYPFVFGFTVYSNFQTKEVEQTGIMSMPTDKDTIMGGHAVMAVGYNENKKCFVVRNSWGKEWGEDGYFYMPYKFIVNNDYCSDFWVIEKVKDICIEEPNDDEQQEESNINDVNSDEDEVLLSIKRSRHVMDNLKKKQD